MKKFIKKWWLLGLILLISLFFRAYQARVGFSYNHDNDLASWIIKDIVVNKHLRLVAHQTSTDGIFIGPLFYYLQLPFYLLNKMDPIGGVYAATIVGLFSTFSFWFVFTKTFGKKEGYIAALIQAFSYYLILNDREVVPTMPAILWTVWYLYDLALLLKGDKKGLILLGLLIGLIWSINMALIVPLLAGVVAIILAKKKLSKEGLLKGFMVLFISSLPLIFFEARHNFLQVRAFYSAFTQPQHDVVGGFAKLLRVILLLGKNVKTFLFGPMINISYNLSLVLSLLAFAFLYLKRALSKNLTIVLILWVASFIGFFSLYSKTLSEYYLNGALIFWIVTLTLLLSQLLGSKYKVVGLTLFAIYLLVNSLGFFTHQYNGNGYMERKAVVKEIDEDRLKHGFPCISISYIVNPGYDLGYRYLFYLRNMHVNHPDSGAPVYTIVFPQKDIFVTDKAFGGIGLIYPDYSRYTKEGIKFSCSGANSNLTDPMFGYTE